MFCEINLWNKNYIMNIYTYKLLVIIFFNKGSAEITIFGIIILS